MRTEKRLRIADYPRDTYKKHQCMAKAEGAENN